jgi:uncharacterized protein (UPF0333 family)
MKTNQILSIAIALIIGGVGGYFIGGSNTTNSDAYAKREQEAIVMMKDQATTITKMAQVMKTSGTMMQAVGTQYKNDEAVNTGKDLEMMGTKYLTDTTKTTGTTGSMNSMMK